MVCKKDNLKDSLQTIQSVQIDKKHRSTPRQQETLFELRDEGGGWGNSVTCVLCRGRKQSLKLWRWKTLGEKPNNSG